MASEIKDLLGHIRAGLSSIEYWGDPGDITVELGDLHLGKVLLSTGVKTTAGTPQFMEIFDPDCLRALGSALLAAADALEERNKAGEE